MIFGGGDSKGVRGVLCLEGGKRRDWVREKGGSFRGQHEASYHESTRMSSTILGIERQISDEGAAMGREEAEVESLEGVGPSRLRVIGVGWFNCAVEKSIPHFSTLGGALHAS